MPTIAEIYCKPIQNMSLDERLTAAQSQICLLTGKPCDGGGNRYASDLDISKCTSLVGKITSPKICSSICSIQVGSSPANFRNWIVCPRRLLCYNNNSQKDPQFELKKLILRYAGLEGKSIAIWKEVKLKYSEKDLTVDYTFDYVISQVDASGKPIGSPVIIEVMTSSTSGGNKAKRTTIPNAFEDCITQIIHTGPGINYRQVWGRMVSQFFVKSELAKSWGGQTFWVIQDSLLNYIERTTGFDRTKFVSDISKEINLISCGFGSHNGVPKLSAETIELFAGNIDFDTENFTSILSSSLTPPYQLLENLLISKEKLAILK